MTPTKLTAVLLAVLLVATGVTAALPGNAPTDADAGQADDHYDDSAEQAPDDNADDGLNTSDDAREGDDAREDGESREGDDARADGDVAVEGPTTDGDEIDTSEAEDVPGDVPPVDVPGDAQAGDDGDRGAKVSDQGPPVELPAQVPDFVGEVHDLIRQFKVGDLTDSLGAAISDVTPGDEAGNETADEGGMPESVPAA